MNHNHQQIGQIGIVLLAAGEACRFGSPKQLLPVDKQPLVRRMAQTALEISSWTTVVTGAHRDEVEDVLDDLPLNLLFHQCWRNGLGSSIAYGARHMRGMHPSLSAIIICLCDQAAIHAGNLLSLVKASQRAPERIIAAEYGGDGTRGTPCLFPVRFLDELIVLNGAQGASGMLASHANEVVAVPMPEAAVDIDTPDDYRAWLTHA